MLTDRNGTDIKSGDSVLFDGKVYEDIKVVNGVVYLNAKLKYTSNTGNFKQLLVLPRSRVKRSNLFENTIIMTNDQARKRALDVATSYIDSYPDSATKTDFYKIMQRLANNIDSGINWVFTKVNELDSNTSSGWIIDSFMRLGYKAYLREDTIRIYIC